MMDESADTVEPPPGQQPAGEARIMVAVRKRPLLPAEQQEADVVAADMASATMTVSDTKLTIDMRKEVVQRGTFHFDHVFDQTCSNARVYAETTRPLLEIVRGGGSAVVFAFGQTGSGKTHTMLGGADRREHGLYALAAHDIIATLRGMRLSVSFYEIYGGKLFDLLNARNKVQTLEDEHKNVNLVGLTEHPVRDHAALLALVERGAEQRSSGSTHVNDRSSRSHAVLVLTVKTRREKNVFGRMSFIDLAGSERAKDTTDLDKKTRAEGAEINKSLLALKECIRNMYEGKKHIPFRGSKLTQILRDSFTGNCATLMIANVSPCQGHCDDTVNALKYTNRIKEMQAGRSADPAGAAAHAAAHAEPSRCDKCGFPIFCEDAAQHVCPKQFLPCKHCKALVVTSKMATHVLECIDAPTECTGCKTWVIRSQLHKHRQRCPAVEMACKLCGERMARRDADVHAGTCSGVRVACPHCRAATTRGELAEHAEACPQRRVACAACGFLVRAALLPAHRNKCIGGIHSSIRRVSMGSSRNTSMTVMPPMEASKPRLGHLKVAVTPSRLPPLSLGAQPARPESSTQLRKSPATTRQRGAATPRAAALREAPTPNTARAIPAGPLTADISPKRGKKVTPAKQATPAKKEKEAKKSSAAAAKRDGSSPYLEPLTPPRPTSSVARPTSSAARPTSSAARSSSALATRSPTGLSYGTPSPNRAARASCPYCAAPFGSDSGLQQHLVACADNGVVPCPFADAGCRDVVRKSEVAAHVQSAMAQHLVLVHAHSQAVSRENGRLQVQLDELKAAKPPAAAAPAASARRPTHGRTQSMST
jgi:kinesin family protein 2/24